MGRTHHRGQKIVDCPGCNHTIRLQEYTKVGNRMTRTICGECDTVFLVDRKEVDIIDVID